ncbi:MAG: hypothetical protein HY698_06885 [Deltaproteobacteria bacterium]|nr:hypothetical protein [Deltaproteobacteria bacterium]
MWKAANVAMVSLGHESSCALLQDGTVTCWGDSDYGQLGSYSRSSGTPGSVLDLSSVTAISSGEHFTCALRQDESVACWGRNSEGQLGNDTLTNSAVPVGVVNLMGATAIATGAQHACAIKKDKTIVCWGYNGFGQLGQPRESIAYFAIAPVAVPGITDVVGLALGSHHTCSLHGSGVVNCWGYNVQGQLGHNMPLIQSTPIPQQVANLGDAVAVAAGSNTTCAIRQSGTVACWGENSMGQLGDNSLTTAYAPVAVQNLTDVTAIAVGSTHGCALRSDRAALCWGSNFYGELGTGSPLVPSRTPVLVANFVAR